MTAKRNIAKKKVVRNFLSMYQSSFFINSKIEKYIHENGCINFRASEVTD
jgi:hypothetical protein